MRKAGILMPVSAIGGRNGCGEFGKETLDFIDMIHEAGFKIWQILPLNPLGKGNSPYACDSSFAIDDIYISLDKLHEKGLIDKVPSFHRRKKRIDYPSIRKFREPYLREAYKNFVPDHAYSVFAYQEWVKNYAIYCALRKANPGKIWYEWDDEMKFFPENGKLDLKPYQDEILYQTFLQYEAFLEWKEIKQYANDHDVEIMGDIPFYVGMESSDVFSNKDQFLLEKDGRPQFIAGVPPDYFSATGQRWGNPIYDWDHMKEDHFEFWLNRLSYTQRLFDIVRVDHFRAFDTYWKIPESCPTAMDGEWIEAPGYDLFNLVQEKNPELEIVAEDLGDMREEVYQLRDHFNFRGMRIIQFTWNNEGMPKDKEHLIIYTGTHDNMPIKAWYETNDLPERRRMRNVLKKMGYHSGSFLDDLLQYTLDSNADMCIIPMCDWLHLGKDARINLPGSLSDDNWSYRLLTLGKLQDVLPKMKEMIQKSNR